MKIGHREVGNQAPVFIIAELSANHQQKFEVAAQTIRAAKEIGADAIKLQTYTPDTITIDANTPYFKIRQGTIWDGKTLYELYREAYTPWEWQPKLKRIAEELGLLCFSSPFDRSAVDFLEKMEVPAYKIASFEINDIPLIEYVARQGKPVIISTGIATLNDIEEAIDACRRMGNKEIALLKCTSAYPAPFEEARLLTIPFLREKFGVIAGLSDHTEGIAVPIAATALGSKIIEKHLILNRSMGGPDAAFSLEPREFQEMTRRVREVEKAIGEPCFELSDQIKKSRELSRSLFFVRDVKKGEVVTDETVRSIRPGHGLAPKEFSKILGRRIKKDLPKGTPVQWDHLD